MTRNLTTVIVLIVIGMCVMSPLYAYADTKVVEAVMFPAVETPTAVAKDSLDESLVAPPDLLDFVEAQFAHDLVVEVNAAAVEYNVPVELCWSVMRRESGFRHLSDKGTVKRGGSHEVGICQIIPDGMTIKGRHNVWDRADNIRCMADLLAYALHERKYGLEKSLGWYNSGKPIINQYAREVARTYRSWVRQRGGVPL
jgi:hypothetical protein